VFRTPSAVLITVINWVHIRTGHTNEDSSTCTRKHGGHEKKESVPSDEIDDPHGGFDVRALKTDRDALQEPFPAALQGSPNRGMDDARQSPAKSIRNS
jgi:hypothetical protein